MNVIATHAVENMETWLGGGEERAAIFARFCAGYQIYRHPEEKRVVVVFEDVDMPTLEAVLSEPASDEAKVRHTVIDPIEMFVQIPDGK